MSLFQSLFRVFPAGSGSLEDFHTEIVGQILRSLPAEAAGWLHEIGATDRADFALSVTTQEDLEALAAHASGSRPDLRLCLQRGDETQLIFIESKVGSSEGREQLRRYAEHLQQQAGFQKKTLIYITRDYEPKEAPKIPSVQFVATRWSHFHRYFKPLADRSDILRELLTFMEQRNMSQSNRFTSVDLLSLVNFTRARKLMDATLWDDVQGQFQRVFGRVSYKESAFTQLKNHQRYVMFVECGKGRQFGVYLGFWLDQESVTDSPWVGAVLDVNPKAASRKGIAEAFQNFAKTSNGRWQAFDLADDRIWGGMERTKSLEAFLPEEDHVRAISRFFQEVLADVAEFKKGNPQLPWTAEKMEGES